MKRIILCFLLSGALSSYAQDQIDKPLLMDYFQEQQYDRIIQYLEGTVHPKHAYGLSLLGNAYYQSGQFAQAEKYYQLVLAQDSNHIQAHQFLGNIAKQQKQPATAQRHYEKLVKLRPDNAAYYKQLSLVSDDIVGQQDTAFYYMKQAYRLNPKDVSVVTNVASEMMSRKDQPGADSILRIYYATDSTQITVIAQLTKLSFLQKKYTDAALFGERLLDMDVVDPMTYIYLAASYYQSKMYDKCIRVHDKMITLAQAAPETLMYYAGMAYAAQKQYDRSNQMLQACIDMAKSHSLENYYTAMADNYEQMRQFKSAVAHYDTAYYLFKDPMRLYGMGRIYEQSLQNPLKAKKLYQQYLKEAKPEGANETSIHSYVKERVKAM